MGVVKSLVFIACDAAGCTRQITYDLKDEKATFENPENAWMKSLRVVQTADGRPYAYCSDTCEVNGTATGKHNVLEQPKIQPAASAAQIAAAAQMAAQAKAADAAIREGQTAKVQLT